MTPRQFEALHAASWQELEQACAHGDKAPKWNAAAPSDRGPLLDRARFAELYRAACEQLALARSRGYPVAMIERLELLTTRGHQRIYRRADSGMARLLRFVLVDFPSSVRAHRRHVLVALLVFAGPLLAVGIESYRDPGFILSVHNAESVDEYDRMYSGSDGPVGRANAGADWAMFGHYIRNNIGIAFQCFASGLFFGVGSLFFLGLNGVMAGSVAGYLTWRGDGENFYSFVVTHGAFELTAIVLAGAAGLMLGESLLFPGRHKRAAALQLAAGRAIVIVYGVTAMLFVAAGIEAFWSSARWIEPSVKYGVGGTCWLAVIAYFCFQGRPRRA